MGVNSLPKIVTRQRRGCDWNTGPSAPESSMLTTRLSDHTICYYGQVPSTRSREHRVLAVKSTALCKPRHSTTAPSHPQSSIRCLPACCGITAGRFSCYVLTYDLLQDFARLMICYPSSFDHTHTPLMALFLDYLGGLVPER